MPDRRVRLLVTLAMLGPACGSVVAGDPKPADPAADAELLEFLGSVDPGDAQAADDGSWIEYLAQTDIGKVARAARAPGGRPKQVDPPPASGDKKDE